MRYLLFSAVFALLPASVFASIDPALLALLPPNTKLITGVDADRARTSSFGQYMLNRARSNDAHFEQFVNETGFDPRRDLQSFVFATDGEKGNGHFVILARGIFEPDRMKAAAKAHGSSMQSYGGTDIFVSAKGHSTTGFAFLDSSTVALADTATLKQVLDNRNTAPTSEPTLQAQIAKANEGNDAWFVSALPPSFLASVLHRETGESSDNVGALQGVAQSRGGIRFGDTVRFSYDALTRSQQDARSLTDVLRFLASAAQMQRDSDPRATIVAGSLDSMTLTNSGSTVHVDLSLTERKLEQLVDLGPLPRRTARLAPQTRRQ